MDAGRSYVAKRMRGGELADAMRTLRRGLIACIVGAFLWAVVTGAPPLLPFFLIVLLVVPPILLRAIGNDEVDSRQPPTPGQASVHERALMFVPDSGKRARLVDLELLRSAMIVPASERDRQCELVMRGAWGRRMTLAFSEVEDARALLHDMKMSPREESTTFYFFFGLYITVGADGVLLRWPLLGRERFVPYAKILSVTSYFGFIELRLVGGDKYEIMTTSSKRSRDQKQHQALRERIAHACVAYRAEHAEEPIAMLDRSGRSALGWIRDLGVLGNTAGNYRVASLPEETLWSVALDPAAKEESRIGAALALRSALDAEGRQKLRVAAEASASPKLRVALDAAADEITDDELGKALDEALPMRQRI